MSKIGRYFCPECHTVNVMTGNCFKCGALVEDRAPEEDTGEHDEHEHGHGHGHEPCAEEPPTHHYHHIDAGTRLRTSSPGGMSKKNMILIGATALLGLALLMMMGGGQQPQTSGPPPNTSQKNPEELKASADKAIAIAVRYAGFKDVAPNEWTFEDTSAETGASPSFGMNSVRGNQKVLFVVWDNVSPIGNLELILMKVPFTDFAPPDALSQARFDSGEGIVGSGKFRWFVGRYLSQKEKKLEMAFIGAYPSPIEGKAIVVIARPLDLDAAATQPNSVGQPTAVIDYKTTLWLIDTMAAAYTAESKAEREGTEVSQKAPPPPPEQKPLATADQIEAYRKQVEAKIKGGFKPPADTAKQKAIVLIGLTETGSVKKLELKEPSGMETFDQSILKAISTGEPYPAAPHTKSETVDFRVTADGAKVSLERD